MTPRAIRAAVRFLVTFCAGLAAATVNAAPRTDIAEISAGDNFTCATTLSTAAICWGHPKFGELGNGDTVTLQPMAQPVVGLTTGVAHVSAGGGHACAVTTGGGAKCWGFNFFGQLGDGTAVDRPVPVDVVGLTSGVSRIAPGLNHTCALTAGGGVKCWGSNAAGEVGDGTIVNARLTPVDVLGLGSGVTAVGAGWNFSCALTAAGAVKCWGANDKGQLGDGTLVNQSMPADVAGLSSGVTSISVGARHACAVLSSGALRCWGANELGEIGDGTFTQRSTPVAVATLGIGVEAVSAGEAFTCALVSGAVKCWGSNGSGELGDGTRVDRPVPGDVPGLGSGIIQVSAGRDHACAVMSSHSAQCWGYDAAGALGTGTVGVMRLFPAYVGDLAVHSVTFPPVANRDIEDGPFAVGTTSSSGRTVILASQTPSVCSVSGSTVTPLAIGLCGIFATAEGDQVFATSDFAQEVFLVYGSPVAADSRLRSISTRALARQGDDAVIGGFIIDGPGSKTVLIRAIGPSLSSAGVTTPLANPILQLFGRQGMVAANNDWQFMLPPPPIIPLEYLPDTRLGPANYFMETIGFNPSNPLESALMLKLPPGAYTAIAHGADGGNGIALMEVIEIDRADVPLAGISTRGFVGAGEEVMIGGFIIEGSQPMTVAVRARGPSLVAAGVATAMSDPILTLRAADGTVIAFNDNWQTHPNAVALQAFGFAPGDPAEAAVLVTLPPGAYTAVVQGANAGTGIALVEVFAAD